VNQNPDDIARTAKALLARIEERERQLARLVADIAVAAERAERAQAMQRTDLTRLHVLLAEGVRANGSAMGMSSDAVAFVVAPKEPPQQPE
jgi:hypothetical protein